MFTFSANLAYLPSSVTKSAEHFFKCARRYFRTNLSTGRITEHAKARRLQCLKKNAKKQTFSFTKISFNYERFLKIRFRVLLYLRLTRELGSGWSVVCFISCKKSSLTKQSFFIALSKTV